MDLHHIDNYLLPTDINQVKDWGEGWSWLAGGTWLFSEPQPEIKTLVDIQSLGWDEIEFINPPNSHQGELLVIGATCPLIKLLNYSWLPEYTAVEGFRGAINALSASLKVVNIATVGGNICLALSVGTLAPIMVALDASYEIWNREGKSRIVAGKDFQIGSRQTILQSGELLRRVLIPVENLQWEVNYQRFGITASDPALTIVVSAYNSIAKTLRLVIAASVVKPVLWEFDCDLENSKNCKNIVTANLEKYLEQNLEKHLENIDFIEDARASAIYRQEITRVLIQQTINSYQ